MSCEEKLMAVKPPPQKKIQSIMKIQLWLLDWIFMHHLDL